MRGAETSLPSNMLWDHPIDQFRWYSN